MPHKRSQGSTRPLRCPQGHVRLFLIAQEPGYDLWGCAVCDQRVINRVRYRQPSLFGA